MKKNCSWSLLLVLMIAPFIWTGAQDIRPGAPDPPVRGRQNAPVQIEVFYDFQCGSCREFQATLANVERRHHDRVRITFRHFPLQLHENAYDAAAAAESAKLQGRFWEMCHLLLAKQGQWSIKGDPRKVFLGYARALGLNTRKFSVDSVGMIVRSRIDQDILRARSLELNSVPSVFLNGRLLEFAEALDLERIISNGNL